MERNWDRPADDQEWVAFIRKGDRAAFEALVQVHYTDIYTFVRHFIDESTVAEDLVQDIFLDMWKRRHTWRLKRGCLKAYLYSAARNRALKHAKRRRRRRDVEQQWEMDEPFYLEPEEERLDSAQAYAGLKDKVEASLDELPERRRLVFALSRQDGLTYREIADVLDISIKTVETQMGRALKLLRDRLAVYR